MRKIYIILTILIFSGGLNSQELKKIPIPTLFNTGVDNNKMPLLDGETDPHYVLSISADPQFSGPDTKVVFSDGFPIGPWIYNDAVSKELMRESGTPRECMYIHFHFLFTVSNMKLQRSVDSGYQITTELIYL